MANPQHLEWLLEGEPWETIKRKSLYNVRLDLSGADLSGKQLCGIPLGRANLDGAKLVGADLENAFLAGASLRKTNLEAARLPQASLQGADLTAANLTNARLPDASLTKAWLDRANLAETDFTGATLERAKLTSVYGPAAKFVAAKLPDANLSRAYLYAADFTGATLSGADLSLAMLVEAKLKGADLTDANVYGISAWDIALDEQTRQQRLRIEKPQESAIIVDDLELAHFIYLLLDHRKLRNVIDAVTRRGVLLLGRFTAGGLELLQGLAARLRELGYLPIIFDFERSAGKDCTETVQTLAGLARFVVVNLSGPSVPQELQATVPHQKIPYVPLVRHGELPHGMFPDFLGYPWVLRPPVEYDTLDGLVKSVAEKIVAPAEEKYQEREALLKQLYDR